MSRTQNSKGLSNLVLGSPGTTQYLRIHHTVCLEVHGAARWLFRETEKPGESLCDIHRSNRRITFGFGAVPCYCCRARSSFGGEAVYPCGCRGTRCTTLRMGTEVPCCPWDKPVSVGAGRHLSDSLGKGVVFTPAAAEAHSQSLERPGCIPALLENQAAARTGVNTRCWILISCLLHTMRFCGIPFLVVPLLTFLLPKTVSFLLSKRP